jgi:hypothetical protein
MEMRIFLKQLLASGLAVLAIAGVAQGEDLRSYPPSTMNTSEAAVAVVPPTAELRCTATSPQHALEVADQAWQDGSYQLAGECYLAAGEPARADRAFLKAVAPQAALSSQRLAENREAVKTQIRQWTQALRGLQRAN